MKNIQLLKELTTILNAHQDIEDALKTDPADIDKIKAANDRIGEAVARHEVG